MRFAQRAGAVLVCVGVAVAPTAGFAAPPTVTQSTLIRPATTTDRGVAAAFWLTGRLVAAGGVLNHFTVTFGGTAYDDYGDTADGVLALDAAGAAQTAAAQMTAWLARHVHAYAGTAPNFTPGALAKLAIVAEAQHLDPTAFGGVDLLGRLAAEEVHGSGADNGEFKRPDGQGYENPTTQALAIIALSRSGTPADSAAVGFLRAQQCTDPAGHRLGFPQGFPTKTTGSACRSNVDSTGFAVQALATASGTPATSARNAGLRWLATQRAANGGFGSPENANSSAIAAQALLATGHTAAATRAYLQSLQVGCAGPAGQRGAITYAGSYDDTALKATVQGAQALAGGDLLSISRTGATAGVAPLACAAPVATPAGPMSTPGTATTPGLPRTGPAPVVPTTALGLALVTAGLGLVALGRRRSRAGRHRVG